jgi:SAM-dependent methyltransferase
MKDIYINLEKEIFVGNILDIGLENYGIVYNIAKKYEEDFEVEYLEGKEGKKYIEEGIYDNCILFFSLRNLLNKKLKNNLLKDIYKYLKSDGILYIWDIDKGFGKTFMGKIKISLPDERIKEVYLKDINILNDNSKDTILQLLKSENFDIISTVCSDNIYYIKSKKRGE